MSCEEIQSELVAYHFDTLGSVPRSSVEQHLPECRTCVRAFVALKKEIESGDLGPRASPEARQRLRRAVQSEFDRRRGWRPWTWWERPLAFGLGTAAALVAVAGMHLFATRPGHPPVSLTLEPPRTGAPQP